jgi:CheY-like chemotaxis protein
VRAAWGAEDALRQLRTGFRPCFAVIDLLMPGMDGWGLIERIRADRELAAIAVVILSATVINRARAHEPGVREFIGKPAEPQLLTAAVEQYCGQRGRQSPN